MSRESWIQSVKAGNPVWRQNFLGQRATPDQMLLSKTAERADLLRKIGTQGNLARMDHDLNFLRAQANNPRPNLYRAPRNIQEAALQGMVQDDINSRVAGFNVGYASELDNRRRAFENMNQAFKAMDQGIQLGNAQRQWQKFDLALDKERRQARDSDRNRTLQEQKFLTDQLNDRDQRLFERSMKMLDAGVPAERILMSLPRDASRELRQQIFQTDQGINQMLGREYGLLQEQSENLNRSMRLAQDRALQQYRDTAGTNWRGASNATPEGEAEAVERARQQFLDDLFSNRDIRENVMFDPATGQFKPFAVPPRTAFPAPNTGQMPSPSARSPQPVQVSSPAEAMLLRSGTPFRRPDGVVMIRP